MTFSEFVTEYIDTFNALEFKIDKCKTLDDIAHVKNLHDSLFAQCIGFAVAVKHYENVEKQKKFLRDMNDWSHSVHHLIDVKTSEIVVENARG